PRPAWESLAELAWESLPEQGPESLLELGWQQVPGWTSPLRELEKMSQLVNFRASATQTGSPSTCVCACECDAGKSYRCRLYPTYCPYSSIPCQPSVRWPAHHA